MNFRLANGALEITDATGKVAWSGYPAGQPVRTVVQLFGQDACVVLCDPDARIGAQFENVMRVASDGSVAWRASLPTSGSDDCYTAIGYEANLVIANSWSGFRVRIDPQTGSILNSSFTK